MRWSATFLAAAASTLGAAGCGSPQDRPEVVAVFPANGQVLAAWLGDIRVTYDEPIRVLNDQSARLAGVVTGSIDVRIYPDPTDDHSIVVKPDRAGHYFPNEQHHLVINPGAVVNAKDHYSLHAWDSYFTVGAPPDLFVSSSDGKVYEVDPATGAQVFATAPPAGFVAREIASTDGRIWAWLDPSPGPGNGALATFTPGTATMSQIVTLSAPVGTRTAAHLVVSTDGRTVYATARDSGTNRLRVHRVDVQTQTEIDSVELSQPLSGPIPVWRPGLDSPRNRLYLPFTAGTDGAIAVLDLTTFQELDLDLAPGVNAFVIPDGAGDLTYDPARDRVYMTISTGTYARLVTFVPYDFSLYGAGEPTIVGAPVSVYATPDGGLVLQGLSGYVAGTMEALVLADPRHLDQGFAFVVTDDVGAGPRGSTRLGLMLADPAADRVRAFLDNGVSTSLAGIDWLNASLAQTDYDAITAGTQCLDLATSAPGVAVSATFLYGQIAP